MYSSNNSGEVSLNSSQHNKSNSNFSRRNGSSRGGDRRPSRSGSRFGLSGGGFGGNRSSSFSRKPRKQSGFSPEELNQIIASAKKHAEIEKNTQKEDSKKWQGSFQDLGLPNRILSMITKAGYSEPTEIQGLTIPAVLASRDVVGISQTGSGKTAAFLLPLLSQFLLKSRQIESKKDETTSETEIKKVLVIAPTRELALQIEECLFKLGHKSLNLFSITCIGGSSMGRQVSILRKKPEFVIGTPGRLLDLSNRGIIDFSQFNRVVVDEVDQMFDMGFIDDIESILSQTDDKRQLLFFSATVDKKISALFERHLKNPVLLDVRATKSNYNVEQRILKVRNNNERLSTLKDLIVEEKAEKAIVFSQTKYQVDEIYDHLREHGFTVVSIHGDKTQGDRQRSLRRFKQGEANIIVATNVAARGLDIDNVSHVFNYELPQSSEDYIHRIGRTGRGGKKGVAITLI
jgi:superfamily II DNA/RNA helicase